jgi:acyl-CoA reductase-like NAD-dependent aldehyde dehydrogenase
MPAFDDETFGPVAAITRVRDIDAALEAANASQFGLSGNIWTRDVERARNMARDGYTGGVFIKGITATDPHVPRTCSKTRLQHASLSTSTPAFALLSPVPVGPIRALFEHVEKFESE